MHIPLSYARMYFLCLLVLRPVLPNYFSSPKGLEGYPSFAYVLDCFFSCGNHGGIFFYGYFVGFIHARFKVAAHVRDRARAKPSLRKKLCAFGDGGDTQTWFFAAATFFTGSPDEIFYRMVGFMVREEVTMHGVNVPRSHPKWTIR